MSPTRKLPRLEAIGVVPPRRTKVRLKVRLPRIRDRRCSAFDRDNVCLNLAIDGAGSESSVNCRRRKVGGFGEPCLCRAPRFRCVAASLGSTRVRESAVTLPCLRAATVSICGRRNKTTILKGVAR